MSEAAQWFALSLAKPEGVVLCSSPLTCRAQDSRLVFAVTCFHFPRQQVGRKKNPKTNATFVVERQDARLSSRPPSALWEKWSGEGGVGVLLQMKITRVNMPEKNVPSVCLGDTLRSLKGHCGNSAE